MIFLVTCITTTHPVFIFIHLLNPEEKVKFCTNIVEYKEMTTTKFFLK